MAALSTAVVITAEQCSLFDLDCKKKEKKTNLTNKSGGHFRTSPKTYEFTWERTSTIISQRNGKVETVQP